MQYTERARLAVSWFRQGYARQRSGCLDDAIDAYQRSIALFRTAEAHTFLAWTLSLRGELAAAIHQCELAIEVDPDYGNPYNDIGVYLIRMGRDDTAMSWLDRAKRAPRYAMRCYPYFNLGRVLERKGRLRQALAEFRRAVTLDPSYKLARRAVRRVSRRLPSS